MLHLPAHLFLGLEGINMVATVKDWMRWRVDFAGNMEIANEVVAAQLGRGTYRTMRSGFFNKPQLYMDYW